MTLDVGGDHVFPSLREVRREIEQAISAMGARIVERGDTHRLDELAQIMDLRTRLNAIELVARTAGPSVANDHANHIEALTARLDGQSETIQALVREVNAIATRLDVQRGIMRTDPVSQPLPASPAAPEPDPAPETPEQTATRLLGDPEALAAVLRYWAKNAGSHDRQAIHDEIASQEARYHSCAAGLRLLAAAIAAGSFA